MKSKKTCENNQFRPRNCKIQNKEMELEAEIAGKDQVIFFEILEHTNSNG